jgi:enamine deaminase RidA (YjgF/YER057c/UK114 family)
MKRGDAGMSFEKRLEELAISIPPVPRPVAAYVPVVRAGRYVYTSGQLPLIDGLVKYQGKVGRDLTVEEGYLAARICALNCLGAVRSLLESLDPIERIVKVTGFVNSAEGFNQQPQVLNGASELLEDIFGGEGRHVRSAVGVGELPLNAAVEVEMIVQIRKM